MARETQQIKSQYGNESKTNVYDRFSADHIEEIVKNVDASLADDVLRMSRAFPSVRVFFVESDGGILKTDDDTFGWGSVESVTIHKNREQAADTAVIRLTNFLGHLDNKEFESLSHADQTSDPADIFNDEQSSLFEDMMVRAGTRIQVKMGYTSYEPDLENVFTGKITEIEYGDIITIVAQGYGVELLQPLGHDYWGKIYRDQWANPRRMLIKMLQTRPVKHLGRWELTGRSKDASTPGWKRLVFPENDLDDNIYLETGQWWTTPDKWCTDFKIYHENAWEAIKDLERRFPGYIASVLPFDSRGTFFFGLPDSTYYYTKTPDDYVRRLYRQHRQSARSDGSNKMDLNKKMFRGYHFKTSERHIIANNIKIDLSNFYNRVTITYNRDSMMNNAYTKKKTEDHYTVLADNNIDQEYWKTLVVFEENCENKDQAYRYALGRLLLTTKRLYDGELVILGDPKIKPHDVVLIYDNYTGMYGPIGVREVVHTFNKEEGFTTTIVPDLMVYVNTPISMLANVWGIKKSSTMAALSYYAVQSLGNFPLPVVANSAFPVFMARLGWQGKTRHPIGVIPLMYNNKPYIAGFEGVSNDSWITRTVKGWIKGGKEFVTGIRQLPAIGSTIRRRLR